MVEIITSWLGLILMLIGAVATFIGPKAWPSIRNWYSRVTTAVLYPFKGTERKVLELAAKHEQVHESIVLIAKKLDDLAEQFKPNGGSSIKDSLNRIELKQASNENITSFLINSLEVPMFKTDSSGLFIWASRAYCNISGRPSEDLVGWGWVSCINNEDVERVRTKWRLSIEEKRIFEDKHVIVRPDGSTVFVNVKAAPTFFNSRIAGWVGALEVIK